VYKLKNFDAHEVKVGKSVTFTSLWAKSVTTRHLWVVRICHLVLLLFSSQIEQVIKQKKKERTVVETSNTAHGWNFSSLIFFRLPPHSLFKPQLSILLYLKTDLVFLYFMLTYMIRVSGRRTYYTSAYFILQWKRWIMNEFRDQSIHGYRRESYLQY
jgi:hypothetical protein